MSRKTQNSILLFILVILIAGAWAGYYFFMQQPELEKNEKELRQLQDYLAQYDPVQLQEQLQETIRRYEALDSLLALRKFNIPHYLGQSKFYAFVNRHTRGFSEYSKFNIEYQGIKKEGLFFYYHYVLSGRARFNDFFKLLYAIEESKELKKVRSGQIAGTVELDDEKIPHFLVSFQNEIGVYYAADDKFASRQYTENDLRAGYQYNQFFPLIRNEIPPNLYERLEIEGAKLLALLPDGAFLAGANGETYLLLEGDPVYLGYLTEIDYEDKSVDFFINRGGIVEIVTLNLYKEETEE